MANPPLDPKIHALLLEYKRQGLSERRTQKAMANAHGVRLAHGTIHKFFQLACPGADNLIAGVPANKKRGVFRWREWAKHIETAQELKRQGSWSQDRAEITLGDGSGPVALASFSDQHMGSWGCNYKGLADMTDELLATDDLYIGLLGDYGQYSIKLRNVLEVSDNAIPPEQQTDFLEDWFNEIWHKVAFATWENHGVERQEQLSGESSTKKILSRKVTYFNGIGHIDLRVGAQVYRGAVSHKFRGRSMYNPVHAQMRYMAFEGTDREWAMAGDTHQAGMLKYTSGDKTRVAINAGSLQENSGFGKRYFSLTTHPVYPIVVFYPDKHVMTPFWSIKEWLESRKSPGRSRSTVNRGN